MGRIHHGQENLPRYQLIHWALKHRGRMTTAQLQALTNDMAPATTISEMRAVGYPVSHAIYLGKSNGRKVFAYELVTI